MMSSRNSRATCTILLDSDKQVLRLAKQRVGRRQHLVKREARLELAQPERRLGADEVHLVAAARQRLAELGGDDAAAADRGVADHADVHRRLPVRQQRRPDDGIGRTTKPSANAHAACAPNCASRLSMSCGNSDEVSRVATASAAVGLNWLAWQASARRFVS